MTTNSTQVPHAARRLPLGKTLAICALLIATAVAALWLIFNTEPTAERETATRTTAMLVETTRAKAGTFRPTIKALGTVTAARDITLRPQVGGQITEVAGNFTPGGFVSAGEVLLRIDEADYRNALRQRETELQQAIANLEIELGRQDVAEQDYRALERTLPPEKKALVLREPQLRSADAQVQAAEAAVEQARLDLQRTSVTAPFDAQVITQQVNLGSQVAAGDALGRLVGTDVYWIETTVPVARLSWLSFPGDDEAGSAVRVRNRTAWPAGQSRGGSLYKLIGELESQTRLARVLVAVEDPLARNINGKVVPRLLLGEFVECRIRGRAIADAYRIRREHIRKNDTLWIMRDGKLEIRPLNIVVRDDRFAYVREGINEQDQVVTTNLSTVNEGARLRLRTDTAQAPAPAKAPASPSATTRR